MKRWVQQHTTCRFLFFLCVCFTPQAAECDGITFSVCCSVYILMQCGNLLPKLDYYHSLLRYAHTKIVSSSHLTTAPCRRTLERLTGSGRQAS